MGESQVPYPYEPARLKAIRASISEPRFATYLEKGGNHEEYALELYLYNSRLAKAFLFPLSVAEITLRNAIDELLVRKFEENWHKAVSFRDETLTPEGLLALDRAIDRAGENAPRSQVVAELTFDFWSNLFRPEYGDLWRTTVNIAFPNLVHGESRRTIQKLVKPINRLRNRVAHHEPILDMNVNDLYAKIFKLIELRCAETAGWMKHHCTLNTVTRNRPKPDGSTSQNLASKLDKKFMTVKSDTILTEILYNVDENHPAIICFDENGSVAAAFTIMEVTHYLAACSKELDGLVALNEHRVSDMLDNIDFAGRWSILDDNVPLAVAIEELKRPSVRVLVGRNANNGKPSGAVVRAHRRY